MSDLRSYAATDLNQVYWLALCALLRQPFTQPSRNGVTSELHPAALQVEDVQYRSLTLPRRKKNLLLQLTEFLWVWAGSNALEPVAYAAKQWREYSDDGRTLSGAYGHRLRTSGDWGQDQISRVIERLRADPNDRQAVLTIWQPEDLWSRSKDLPCNNWLHFLIRDGRLDLTVAVRSNDIFWGVPYNAFNWMQLQCIVSDRLGVPPGTYTHIAESLHLYEEKREEAQEVTTCLDDGPRLPLPMDGATDEQLQFLWTYLNSVRSAGDTATMMLFGSDLFRGMTPFWQDYGRAIAVCVFCKQNTSRQEYAWSLVDKMATPLKVEVAQRYLRWLRTHCLPTPGGCRAWVERLEDPAAAAYVIDHDERTVP